MEIADLIDALVDRGIAAARRDYENSPDKMRGAVAGFEACRRTTVDALPQLLTRARLAADQARREESDDYWEIRCYEAEVEWICNCVSVVLHLSGQPTIMPPTALATMAVIDALTEHGSPMRAALAIAMDFGGPGSTIVGDAIRSVIGDKESP